MLAASVYIVYISQLVHVHAILGHVPSAETFWKELRCWHTGYYNKPTLFLGGNHCSKISAVDISQIINSFHFYAYFFSFPESRTRLYTKLGFWWGPCCSSFQFFVFCFSLTIVLCVQCFLCLWIVHSVVFSVLFLLTTPVSGWLLIIAISAI